MTNFKLLSNSQLAHPLTSNASVPFQSSFGHLGSFSEKSANSCSFSVKCDDYELPQSVAETDVVSNPGMELRTQRKFSNSRKTESSDMLYDIVSKSREIHRKMMIKRDRWKPSELELAILKLYFEKNQYPSTEEKQQLRDKLEESVSSKVNINQISRWFQTKKLEREKKNKICLKKNHKTIYKKFTKDELNFLKESFTKKNYPRVEEMKETADKMGVNLSKIENWYKHNRRMLSKNGSFYLKSKKYFKKSELNYLMSMFEKYPRPSKDTLQEIAQKLNCTELQIKNWYSNKRKKVKVTPKTHIYGSFETDLHLSEPSMRLNSPLELQSHLSSQSYGLESNPFTEITPTMSSDVLKKFLALREMNTQALKSAVQPQFSLGNYFNNNTPPQQQQSSPPHLPLLLNHSHAVNNLNSMIIPQAQAQTQNQTQNQYLLIPTSNISIAQTSSNNTTPQIIILHSNGGTAPQLNHQAQTLQLSQLLNSQHNNIAQNLGGYSIIRQTSSDVHQNNVGNYYNALMQNNYNHNHNAGLQSVHLVNDPNKLNTTIQQLLNLQDIAQQNHGGHLLQNNNHLFLSGGQNYFSSRNSHFTG